MKSRERELAKWRCSRCGEVVIDHSEGKHYAKIYYEGICFRCQEEIKKKQIAVARTMS